jgi:hypothetical protein
MLVEKNEGGGKSVFLTAGDRLTKVPKSHRELLIPCIQEAFADPSAHFLRVAKICPFPQMAKWLKALVAGGTWMLGLHRGDQPGWTQAGFLWFSDEVRSAEISPSIGEPLPNQPTTLQRYYSLVDCVSWMPFGCAGGLEGCRGHPPLTEFYYDLHAASIDPNKTFAFGFSPNGDTLIYTEDDRAGWLCHENGRIHLLGSVKDTIQWVYKELLADRCPEFDYGWL